MNEMLGAGGGTQEAQESHRTKYFLDFVKLVSFSDFR